MVVMETLFWSAVMLYSYSITPVALIQPECVIELHCMECVPEHMPLVTSHRVGSGKVALREGERLTLSCGAGRLVAYPLTGELVAVCEAGRYRVGVDGRLRHLLELGCQENVFEDVQHVVAHCGAPLQGHAYRTAQSEGARHLATVCFDADRAVAVRTQCAARRQLPLPPHNDHASPLSLLGNFNRMFDATTRAAAERLYSDAERMNRRLHEIFKYDRVSFAGQALTSASLLSPHYFDDQDMRVANFVSNKVAVWSSVAAGNLRHVQLDVARLLAEPGAGPLLVHAGTHGVAALRTENASSEIFLQGERFPVPKYIWTVVHDPASARALAVVVLNDPFVAVSEVRAAVLCASACARVTWLTEAKRARRFEAPLYGLTFCCGVHDAAAILPEIPRAFASVPPGDSGMLTDFQPLPLAPHRPH